MLKLLWLGLMCLVLSVACANSPTPTPLPPVIGYMLGTPYPTYTPRPPTRTPDSASIANARATITAINQALPTPASTPTPTPRPTYRNRNSDIAVVTPILPTAVSWRRHQPRPYYSIDTPRIWQITVDEPQTVTIDEPRGRASLTITDYYSEFGWDGETIDQMMQEDMTNSGLTPGFRLVETKAIGPTREVTYRITGDSLQCDLTGYVKFVLTENRYYIVDLVVCDFYREKFNRQSVGEVLDSFVYEEE